jgi:23S rRNA pseudouridine2605 synthase
VGLVTTERDEKGRPTVFAALPEGMPRVMSVGRLDLNSEGLLLLTNDGDIKRKLELPSTGWTRKYRVRVHGTPEDAAFEPLRRGIEVDGELPADDGDARPPAGGERLGDGEPDGRQEPRGAPRDGGGGAVGEPADPGELWPVPLGELAPGAVEEVRPRVLRDQLGWPRRRGPRPARAEGAVARRGDAPGPRRGG